MNCRDCIHWTKIQGEPFGACTKRKERDFISGGGLAPLRCLPSFTCEQITTTTSEQITTTTKKPS